MSKAAMCPCWWLKLPEALSARISPPDSLYHEGRPPSPAWNVEAGCHCAFLGCTGGRQAMQSQLYTGTAACISWLLCASCPGSMMRA